MLFQREEGRPLTAIPSKRRNTQQPQENSLEVRWVSTSPKPLPPRVEWDIQPLHNHLVKNNKQSLYTLFAPFGHWLGDSSGGMFQHHPTKTLTVDCPNRRKTAGPSAPGGRRGRGHVSRHLAKTSERARGFVDQNLGQVALEVQGTSSFRCLG